MTKINQLNFWNFWVFHLRENKILLCQRNLLLKEQRKNQNINAELLIGVFVVAEKEVILEISDCVGFAFGNWLQKV